MTSNGQTTIPAEVRKYLRVRQGDYLIFKEEAGKLVLAKAVLTEV